MLGVGRDEGRGIDPVPAIVADALLDAGAFGDETVFAIPDRDAPADREGLSTDYLNPYSEILMLIEMAAFDEAALEDLSAWRPTGYRDYFARSPLRRAPSALAAYEGLEERPRAAFEHTIRDLDRLASAAVLALQPPASGRNRALVGETVGPAMRRLIDRAAAFLNSDGTLICDSCDEPQAIIDRLMG